MKKVVVDPGHGGSDPGAVYHGLKEKNVVLEVCLILRDMLQWMGLEVVITREDDTGVSLTGRCEIANFSRADIFVSVHCNADPDPDLPGMPEAKGEEIWIHQGSREGRKLAERLKHGIDLIFPDEPFRGIKESDHLYVLKYTRMPACLIEIGFIDKSSSKETFTNPVSLKKIAGIIADGIMEYFETKET